MTRIAEAAVGPRALPPRLARTAATLPLARSIAVAGVMRHLAPRVLPAEPRRRIVLRYPRLPLAAPSFAEAGRRRDAAFFESFSANTDPYRLAASPREREKYAALLGACGPGPFASALPLARSTPSARARA